MSDRTYDAFGHRFMIPLVPAGVAIDGTCTALAAEAASSVPVPFACKLVSGSRINVTGATDAVALVSAVIAKSAAGTGTITGIGTFVWNGTCATGATGSAASVATGTAAELAANDVVLISEAIGTVASIATHAFTLGLEEMPN